MTADHITGTILREKFDVTCNGFLPAKAPLQRLPHELYAPWERLAHNIPGLIKNTTLRHEIKALDILSTDSLRCDTEWRRAYVILAFLAQAYIWGGDIPEQVLPPAISVPFLAISQKLELPPVLTYAASNLWNFTSTSSDFTTPENLHTIHTFTGTEDESWFFIISVAMEAKAGQAIPVTMRALEAAKVANYAVVREALQHLEMCIREVGALLERMHEKCDPSVFFHHIRPFLAGSKNMSEAGLPRGVFYDTGDGQGQWMQLRGGSNGQSSVIQFFDLVLGVEHANKGNHTPHSVCGIPGAQPSTSPSFHEEVREYMPGPHRRLLRHVKENCVIRDLALSAPLSCSSEQEQLHQQYSATVRALSEFRNKHIQIVTRYIVLPSRQTVAATYHNLAAASMGSGGRDDQLTGTGGTMLMPFLKQARHETEKTAYLDGRIPIYCREN